MKTLCYSVRLESLVKISDKAYKATCFDGTTDIIPASQVFGQDYEVMKCEAYWISAWILKQKKITYSTKKTAFFKKISKDSKKTIVKDTITITRHRPAIIKAKDNNIINELKKDYETY